MDSDPRVRRSVLGSSLGTVILAVIVLLGASGIAATGYLYVYTGHQRCLDRQSGWDNQKDAWISLTAPVVYPPSSDPSLVRAQEVANEARADRRKYLLSGLGERPDC